MNFREILQDLPDLGYVNIAFFFVLKYEIIYEK